MKTIGSGVIVLWVILTLVLACGRKEEGKTAAERGKVEQAVKEAVTKELKMYEGAKQALEKIEKETKERREEETKQ